ncbi:MAG: CPBP family intramembrane glutamic endopeptidase [Saprospiraceae bacterium]
MTRPVWTFIAFAYGITWIILITGGLLLQQNIITKLQFDILYLFGALGPCLGAFWTARFHYGKASVARLWATFSFKNWNKTVWLLILSPWLLFAVGLLVYRIITGAWFTFAITKQQFELGSGEAYFAWITPFFVYAFLEEVGWRGFLLPHLQAQRTAFSATALLTLIWGGWHLPMFWVRFDFSIGIAIGFFFGIFVGALILTALFNQSKGSIGAAILFHLNNNLASAFEQQYVVAVLSTGFVLLAIYLLRQYGAVNLSATPRIKNFYQLP